MSGAAATPVLEVADVRKAFGSELVLAGSPSSSRSTPQRC